MRLANDTPSVEAPTLAKYGVLSPACTIIDLQDGHWQSDFVYQIADANVSVENQVIVGAAPGKTVVLTSTSSTLHRAYHPFNIQTSITVSTLGLNDDEVQKRLEDVTEIVTQKAVERELWEGGIASLLDSHPQADLDGNRHFTGDIAVDVTPTPGTAVHPDYGVALLEDAIAANTIGYKGTLHAPRIVASKLDLEIVKDEDLLTTKLGSNVVAGVGYTKRGPDGTLATGSKAWLYMTGPVTVILGKPEIMTDKLNQAVSVSNNQLSYYIDRPAAIVWSTQHLFAVQVDVELYFA